MAKIKHIALSMPDPEKTSRFYVNDTVAGVERGKDYAGIHHIGFQVSGVNMNALQAAVTPSVGPVNGM
jgi:catechol 2,3-dioxygenase-like lactoylglutathione lyase family enzyme